MLDFLFCSKKNYLPLDEANIFSAGKISAIGTAIFICGYILSQELSLEFDTLTPTISPISLNNGPPLWPNYKIVCRFLNTFYIFAFVIFFYFIFTGLNACISQKHSDIQFGYSSRINAGRKKFRCQR